MENNPDINLAEKELQAFYSKYFGYYNSLNTKLQKFFIDRCLEFISGKKIVGAEGFIPDNKVKAIVAASAVQLTLGLETWGLQYFETIIIHPKEFDNKPTGLKFKGETNMEGYIRLSWKSFISGYAVKDDNLNLGLHEFTHALRFNPISGLDQDYFVEHYFDSWLASANEAFVDLKQGRESIFRKYGGVNIIEFLSVCIEHYFESPEEIKQHYPFLYYSVAILLNQQTQNGVTEINIRQRLFEEKNRLIAPMAETHLNAKWDKTSSFKMVIAVFVPLIYTIFETGITSAASLLLTAILGLTYLRFDYLFITANIKSNRFYLRKGFFIFRNRKKINADLSQVISLRLIDNGTGDSECTLIYYNVLDNYFYSEDIDTGITFSNEFLNHLLSNKIGVYRS